MLKRQEYEIFKTLVTNFLITGSNQKTIMVTSRKKSIVNVIVVKEVAQLIKFYTLHLFNKVFEQMFKRCF